MHVGAGDKFSMNTTYILVKEYLFIMGEEEKTPIFFSKYHIREKNLQKNNMYLTLKGREFNIKLNHTFSPRKLQKSQ